MVHALRLWSLSWVSAPLVRPWGLAASILVLVVCLPLLRPLRYPLDPSGNEIARLATIGALVEHRTLSVDHTSFAIPDDQLFLAAPEGGRNPSAFSKQPPVMAALLAGPYWVLHRLGYGFNEDAAFAAYILTLLGCTLPVAGAAGLAYRMGRIFELRRPMRMLLAIACVFGTGLVSYATVLNSHAPAAALMMAAASALVYAWTSRSAGTTHAWAAAAGFCTALAAVIDLGAIAFLLLFPLVVLALPRPVTSRLASLFWYILAAAPPLLLHAALIMPITGDIRPGLLHTPPVPGQASAYPPVAASQFDDDLRPDRPWLVTRAAANFAYGILGQRGLLSHFPILLLGISGLSLVLHRHWPAPAKAMAMASFLGAIGVVGAYIAFGRDWHQPMYSVRWFIVFMPLLVFWGGAWLRRSHHPVLWTGAAALLLFSIATTLLGAATPFIRAERWEHTSYAAARQLFKPPPPQQVAAYIAPGTR